MGSLLLRSGLSSRFRSPELTTGSSTVVSLGHGSWSGRSEAIGLCGYLPRSPLRLRNFHILSRTRKKFSVLVCGCYSNERSITKLKTECAQPKRTSSGKFYRVSWKSAMCCLKLSNDSSERMMRLGHWIHVQAGLQSGLEMTCKPFLLQSRID